LSDSAKDSSQIELAALRALSHEVPNLDSAIAEVARLSAAMTLPMGTIHVISDIHGEDKKLRHVINNASGSLRPLLERLFKGRLDAKQFQDLLTLIFYPAEVTERLERELKTPQSQRDYALGVMDELIEVVRVLAGRHSLQQVRRVM